MTIAAIACATPPLHAAAYITVPLRVEPAQPIGALTLRSGELVQSVDVVDGKALVPDTLPLPWSIGLIRFEPIVYTRDDLAGGKALLLRELGFLRGVVRRPLPKVNEAFTCVLRRVNTDDVDEFAISVPPDGAFEIRVPAGIYDGAILGAGHASRIRSGIVVASGKPTDVGPLVCEPAVPVSLRVLDARTGQPLPRVTVKWDPPNLLNASSARALYAKRWSASTDSRGIATISNVGPLPIPVRWRVETKGYSPQWAMKAIAQNERVTLPDIRLRQQPVLIVRVHLPDEDENLAGAGIVGALQDPSTHHFVPATGAALREGETRLTFPGYGRVRLLVKSSTGKPILYRDFDLESELMPVDLLLQATEIHGTVTRGDEPVDNIQVWLSDPQDASVVLNRAQASANGAYSMTTFQSGDLRLHTVGSGDDGVSFGPVFKRLTTDGRSDYRVDFELPTSGVRLSVVDAVSRTPVRARIDKRIELKDRGTLIGSSQTDANGRMVFSGYTDGTARLHIQAKGYRTQDVEIALSDDPKETVVALSRGAMIIGRVVDTYGAPIGGARISGGYVSENEMQGSFVAASDATGRFTFDSPPDGDTPFYVAAPRHALAVTTLHEGENVIVLHPPGTGVVSLRPNNAPPENIYLVMAAPAGGTLVPVGALDDLAEVNGMSWFQLAGSQKDGSVLLPQFLGPGTYNLYLALKGGQPFVYQRVGAVTAPTRQNVILNYH